jgi:hypothetical protein
MSLATAICEHAGNRLKLALQLYGGAGKRHD